MTKNIRRAVVKPLLKNDLPFIKSYLTTTNVKKKRNFQRTYGILSLEITTQKLPGKSCEYCALVNSAIISSNICLNEKLEIATHQGIKLPNKRLELVSKLNASILTNFY